MGLVVARGKFQLKAGVNEHGWGCPHERSSSSTAQKRLYLARHETKSAVCLWNAMLVGEFET